MNTHRIDEKAVFNTARRIADTAARDEYMAEACGDDQSAIQRIRELLRIHEEEQSFLESPAADLTPTSDLSPITELPGTVIGSYKLLQQIGEGGMGVVFMAEQTEPIQRTVALKIIKPGMDTRQVIARFEAERQALAMMDHPNIAKVLDAGTTDTGRPYFVMELVKGVPITQFCDDKRLPLRERLERFKPVCEAIQHAHQKGIIHRDLKPTNVLVAEYDNRAVPKVIDFGVAKATAQKLTERTMFTEFGQLIGTVEYMSPEQAKFNQLDIDTRSDIYSLGVLLYELLAGSPPFEQKRLREAAFDEVLRIIREEDPPKPSTRLSTCETLPSIAANRCTEPARLSKDVRGELDWIVMKALEKDRNRRYETASALAHDIERYLADEPIEARQPTQTYRLKKLIQRNKVAALATGLVLATLVTGVSVTTWGLLEARQGRALAEEAQHQLKDANDELASQLTRAESAEHLASSQAEQLGQQLYEAKIPQAAKALREGQFGVARDDLNSCPENQRGWEWQWLARQVDMNLPLLSIPGRQLAQFTPDGKQIAAVDASDELSIKFWDATTGTEERTIVRNEKPIKGLLLDADARHLATALEDGTVALWDVESGRQLWSVKPHEFRNDGLAFHPDGTRLASGSWDGTLKLLSTKDGREQLVVRNEQQFRGISFNPTGSRLVTGRRNNGIEVLTPARIWNAETGQMILELENSRPRCAAYSPDGRLIATGGVDGIARLYNAENGALVRTLSGHDGNIHAVSFSPDGTRLATGGGDTTIRIWDVATAAPVGTIRGHGATVNFLSFAPDGRRLASTDGGGMIHVWDTAAIEHLTTVQADSLSFAFSPDSKRIAVGGQPGGVWLVRMDSLLEDRVLTATECLSIACSPDGQQIAGASSDGVIDLWDVLTGKLLRRLSGHEGKIDSMSYSPDGTRLASSSGTDKTVRLWDATTGEPQHILYGHKGPADFDIPGIAFRHDGKQLASATIDGVKIWDVQTGSLLRTLTAGADLQCVAYSPDDNRIVAGGRDGLLHVWNADTGETLAGVSGGHTNTVRGVAFSPDGSRIVSCDKSGMIRLWKGDTGSPILNLREADGMDLQGIAFSPDGKTIAARSGDGAIHIWELEPPSDGYALRRRSQIAARVVEARMGKSGLSPDTVTAIRGDATVPDEVRRLAVRLAEDRLWAAQAIEREKHARLRETAKVKLEQYRQAAAAPDVNANALNNYAWALVSLDPQVVADLESEFPNASRTAVDIAKRGVELAPQDGNIWNTLGVSYYRAADYESAIDTLKKSLELRRDNAFDFFFLAMVQWRLGRKDEAHTLYVKAVDWMDKYQPKNEELIRFRAEAAELLGIAETKPESTSAPPAENPAKAADSKTASSPETGH